MYHSEKHRFDSESELLTYIVESIDLKSKVAIVGGHYMLFYDSQKDELVPLIKQDLTDPKQIEFADLYAGDFPLKTFVYSIELHKNLNEKNIDNKILLLVNDHKFQSSNFQNGITDMIQNRGGELRKKYYSKNEIPNCFQNTLQKNDTDIKLSIFDNIEANRDSKDLLPKDSYFYSEQKLRRRFDNILEAELILNSDRIEKRGNQLFYNNTSNNEICLSENGTCGCSAEVIELINNLICKEFDSILIFTPQECTEAVNNGVSAALNVLSKKAEIYVIEGFGGMGFANKLQSRVTINYHTFN